MKKLLLAATVAMCMFANSAHALLPLIAWPVAHAAGGFIAYGTGGYLAGTLSATWVGAFIAGNTALVSSVATVGVGGAVAVAADQYYAEHGTEMSDEMKSELATALQKIAAQQREEAISDRYWCKAKAKLHWSHSDREAAKQHCHNKYDHLIY